MLRRRVLVLIASEGFLSLGRVNSPFRAATTVGKHFTHSVDRSPQGSLSVLVFKKPLCEGPIAVLQAYGLGGCRHDRAEPGQSVLPAAD